MIVPINGKPTYIPTPMDTSTPSGDISVGEFIGCLLFFIASTLFVCWLTNRSIK